MMPMCPTCRAPTWQQLWWQQSSKYFPKVNLTNNDFVNVLVVMEREESFTMADEISRDVWVFRVFIHWGLMMRMCVIVLGFCQRHDDVIEWKHFLRYWPCVKGIHWSSVNSPHKGQWHEALMFSLSCAWTNGWAHCRDAGDLRYHRAHYDVIVMEATINYLSQWLFVASPTENITWNKAVTSQPKEQTSVKFESKYKDLRWRKFLWKWRLPNDGYFVHTSVCVDYCRELM